MLRKLLILPVIAALALSFSKLFLGEIFGFFTWLFVSFSIAFVLLPIVFSLDEKTVPFYQMIASLCFFILIFSAGIFLDFRRTGELAVMALLFGIALAVLLIVGLMYAKGK